MRRAYTYMHMHTRTSQEKVKNKETGKVRMDTLLNGLAYQCVTRIKVQFIHIWCVNAEVVQVRLKEELCKDIDPDRCMLF